MAQYVACRERVLSQQPAPTGKVPDLGSEIEKILAQAKSQGRNTLSEVEAKCLLKAWGLAVPRGGLARNAAEARSLASGVGGPVALKASSPDLLHKTEAGVIRLRLDSLEEVERAFEEILEKARKWNPEARLDGVLVEEMIGGETREVIVGVRQDLRFGAVVTFGAARLPTWRRWHKSCARLGNSPASGRNE
jgi:acyl-CoA synthetase (NDP forming)